MVKKAFRKVLSGNDLGITGGHQAGILVPKSESELIDFLPPLESRTKNPSLWIEFEDDKGEIWEFRYVYYNNKFHDTNGTRNEYRITHMTKFLRELEAERGDSVELSMNSEQSRYLIRLIRKEQNEIGEGNIENRVKLKGWRRVH